MLNIIKNSFGITNRYIILATPLILFSLISGIYLAYSLNGTILNVIFAMILLFMMVTSFFSGWFFMIKKAVSAPEMNEPNDLIKEFTAGVGEYFLPVSGLFIISSVLCGILLFLAYLSGVKFIGDVGISSNALAGAMENSEALKAFLLSLSREQLEKLNLWNLLLFFTMSLSYYIIMLYLQVLFFNEKNPVKALFLNLKTIFGKKIVSNILLFLFIFVTYVVLSIFTTLAGMNTLMHFIFTLLNFYYIVYVAVLLFNYYYQMFIKIDKTV